MSRMSWKFFSTLITLLTILISSASFARAVHHPSTSPHQNPATTTSALTDARSSAVHPDQSLPDFKLPEPPNMFCNPDYVSAPGEVMVPRKCGPAVNCDSLVWDTDRKSCLLKG